MRRPEKSGYEQLISDETTELSPVEEQWLLDHEEEQSLNNPIPIDSKVVTSAPVATSAPSASSRYFKSKAKIDDEEAQLLSSELESPIGTARPTRPTRSRSLISLDLKGVTETVSKWTHSFANWTSSSKTAGVPSEIQYSVFKPPPYIRPIQSIPEDGFINMGPTTQEMFNNIVQDSLIAITELGISPKRISAGSSGSYFIQSTQGKTVGVFKPKDEEPYGPLSPKWTKWLHRNLFPCFFGRSCLIPNLGYICESAASLLDRQLQIYIVPFTDVISLSSTSFYYSYWDRTSKSVLPPKIGSFQLFLNDYMCADKFFEKYPLPNSRWAIPALYYAKNDNVPIPREIPSEVYNGGTIIDLDEVQEFKWTPEVLKQFREELEKLVILDYIMRNTDRGLDNWMIHIEWITKSNGVKHPTLKIGAIDSGLAFPWKHPDEWRSYPFGWLFLPVSVIGQPFSEKTRNHFLPLLTSTVWWEETGILFRNLFSKDSDFKERMWKKQWSVMKGQSFNVVETLKNPTHGPLELARRTRVLVHDEEMEVPVHIPISVMESAMETPIHGMPAKNSARSNLELITEGEAPIYNTPTDSIQRNEQLQKNWTDLLSGKIDDSKFQSSHKHKHHRHNHPNEDFIADNLNFSPASKRVIIERLQPVTSKPPVFTWC